MHYLWVGKMTAKDPLVSVIVPIYNVDNFLKKCLDSLAKQTMSQIEVICVDDGSTDRSGQIADEYANNGWPVFRIIHTQNRGLSAARNRGIDEARTEWLMFVDSDDWVDKDFCKIPYEAAIENKADMVIIQAFVVNVNEKMRRQKTRGIPNGKINHETAIDVGWSAAWRKLYRRKLFDGIRFPEGHVYEDVAISHHLVYRASCIISVSTSLYYYRDRDGSISHTLSGEDDRLAFSKSRCDDLIQYGYPREKAESQLIGAALRSFGRTDSVKSRVYSESSELLNLNHSSSCLSKKEMIMMSVWRFNRTLYRFLYRCYVSLWRRMM